MKPPISGPERPPKGDTDSTIKKATHALEQKGRDTEASALELLEFRHADSELTGKMIKAARIATGQMEFDENGNPTLPSQNTDLDKSKSVAVQSVLGGIAAAFNLAWITYFGTEMPAELYATIPVFIQLAAQAGATAYNNRK